MNEDRLKGKWNQLKGKVRERWGKLTDDDIDVVQGRSEQLSGKLQERYGIAKDEAQRQIDDFMRKHEAPAGGSQSPTAGSRESKHEAPAGGSQSPTGGSRERTTER